MQSKLLRQAVDLTLDTMGMRGPVKRRDIAEQVYNTTPDEYWSEGDKREARISYLVAGTTERMSVPHSEEYVEQYLTSLSDEMRAIFSRVPRFICISPRGGRESQHVLAFIATRDQWAANFALKDRVVQATIVSRNHSRDIVELLESNNVNSLAELLNGRDIT